MPAEPSFSCVPIGYFRCEVRSKVEAPRQPGLVADNAGRVELEPTYASAVVDLEGFSRVWLVTWLHRAHGWRPQVRPPRAEKKKGLFATRSPHRPNPIGLSAVRLERVEGSVVHVRGHDLIDGTPILDLKPYLPYADAHPTAQVGWVEEAASEPYRVEWRAPARDQLEWLQERGVDLVSADGILALRPRAAPSHRVTEHSREESTVRCELALRTWRIDFVRDDRARCVEIQGVRSGYSAAVLAGDEESRWDDVPLHREFDLRFPC